jgi:1-acyl-sn-glycerol-3-phosphate acyltransferase
MPVRRALARSLVRLSGWKMSGSVPDAGILVGAPHTSRWDWVVMLAIAWGNGVRPRVLIKHTYFRPPLGWLLRRTGGIALDRENPGPTIRALLEEAKSPEPFLLVIAAEGTRGKAEYWKPGFYKIAQQTGLPITLGFVDKPTRTLGMGIEVSPTGDVRADMDIVREFYADKHGILPANRTEPRLREEDEVPPRAAS